jgi:hypothetical protein
MISFYKLTRGRCVANRPPLRTTAEIAEILGMSVRSLANVLILDGAPRPQLDFSRRERGGMGASRPVRYYEPKEVVAWVRQWQEKKGQA